VIAEKAVIFGRIRACTAAKRAYQRAGDVRRVAVMRSAIDDLLDDYNEAVFWHIVAVVRP
jgi:hypothetical protein